MKPTYKSRSVAEPQTISIEWSVSRYEQMASWLVALLILVGALVGMLVLMWLSSRANPPVRAVAVEVVEVRGGGDQTAGLASGGELESPDLAELAPRSELLNNHLPRFIAALPTAIAHRKIPPSVQSSPGDLAASGAGGGGGSGVGPGQGEGEASIARADRWEIRLGEGVSLDEYARRLDYFQIELGLVGSEPRVSYVSQFRSSTPRQRQGPRDTEQRLFLSWRSGKLRQADLDLLTRAGIPTAEQVILQFIPWELENQLATLERQFADRSPQQIRRTQFGVRAKDAGFEFYVIDQWPLVVR